MDKPNIQAFEKLKCLSNVWSKVAFVKLVLVIKQWRDSDFHITTCNLVVSTEKVKLTRF